MEKAKAPTDPRSYPEGRDRVYLSPAHMDLHSGQCGFFVETFGTSFMLGHYDEHGEHARHIHIGVYHAFLDEAKMNAEEFKESCGNEACEKGLKNWKPKRMSKKMTAIGVKR